MCQIEIDRYIFIVKVGCDGGRHGWFKWADGPVPEGKSLTQSISLYDCMIVSITSMMGTPDYDWVEQKPNSDKKTRVLGNKFSWSNSILSDEFWY